MIVYDRYAKPFAAANPAIASLLQSTRLVGRVAELGSLGRSTRMKPLNNADVSIEHMWCGPGKGAALRIRHLPTGVFVERVIGFEPASQHSRHLMEELRRQVHEFQKSDDTPTAS